MITTTTTTTTTKGIYFDGAEGWVMVAASKVAWTPGGEVGVMMMMIKTSRGGGSLPPREYLITTGFTMMDSCVPTRR